MTIEFWYIFKGYGAKKN